MLSRSATARQPRRKDKFTFGPKPFAGGTVSNPNSFEYYVWVKEGHVPQNRPSAFGTFANLIKFRGELDQKDGIVQCKVGEDRLEIPNAAVKRIQRQAEIIPVNRQVLGFSKKKRRKLIF